ncbi:DUF3626 domain-containing protein [Rhodococcus sp. P1Y]|uniref:DUF3626 domain-containing protein n=1 Tax=Rhodococcus sp. P1Y TaxID=1302308 RepID=UPI001913D7BD|nr:DUF3626 domain-containing protein [Rhodococcus sp. P1Y]
MTPHRSTESVSECPPAVTLQFHPDWPHAGRTVIESMAHDGAYRSQFATGISNGGLTAFAGGDRWQWESRLFDGRYDQSEPHERPVYGAWNRNADPYGGAIRFGSSYVVLKPAVLDRITFCFPDSVFEPTDFGDRDALPHLCALADASGFDDLDDCVEAHVHGPVRFDEDVDAVVLDPTFRETAIESAASSLGCNIRFHRGFRLMTSDFDPLYRGAESATLAQALGPVLTPAIIGDAARTGSHDLQTLKRVWHCLARFGRTTYEV